MTERIRQAGSVAWAVVGLVALLVLLGVVAWYLRVIWPPLVLAGAIVFILNPVVTWEQTRGIPRAVGTGLAYLGVLAITALAILLAYPLAADQAEELGDEWPDIRTPLGYGNFLGLPEVSVPAGYDPDGMPSLNLSVVGLPGEDAQVLALAHAYERQSRRFVMPRLVG